jgi:hypothetical protein
MLNYVFTIELLMSAKRRELVPLVPLQIRISPIDIIVLIIIDVYVVSEYCHIRLLHIDVL